MKLPAGATLAAASGLLQQIDAALAAGDTTVDLSALESFDTSAIALLLEARRRATARGQSLVIVGAPPKLRSLAALYGVENLLQADPG